MTELRIGERRAVITGIGAVAPGQTGRKAFWERISNGRPAIRHVTLFDASAFRCRIGAECEFDPAAEGLTPQEIRRMDRAAQFAVVAAREALADSGVEVDALEPHRIAVSLGNALGASITLEQEYTVLSNGGREWLVDHEYAVPHLLSAALPCSIATEIAWVVGAEGPTSLISTGCCAGIDSVGHALDLIREGVADVVVSGATDAPIYPVTVACFDTLRATSTTNDAPETACRPYDRTRNGLVLGEGSAILVIEELEHARRRGARLYGEITGYGARANGFHMTGLKPDGRELADAIRVALDQARLNASDVDYVNGHGSGTPQNDVHETAAYKRSLGADAYRVPISSIKSMVGHSLGAIGSIELAASALALDHQVVPPTANLTEPDPACDLDYVPVTAREQRVDRVLCVGSGFGGFQSAMVLASPRVMAA